MQAQHAVGPRGNSNHRAARRPGVGARRGEGTFSKTKQRVGVPAPHFRTVFPWSWKALVATDEALSPTGSAYMCPFDSTSPFSF